MTTYLLQCVPTGKYDTGNGWTDDPAQAKHYADGERKPFGLHDDNDFRWVVAINEGERSLYRWQHDTLGGFESALWDALYRADSGNLARLEAGYPEHVAALRRFRHQGGYWDALRARIEGRV
jgi:hypothetical protein